MPTGVTIRPNKRLSFVFLLLVLAILPLAERATPAPPIESKEAEARQVMAQIQQLDADLSHVIESFNAAEIELDGIKTEQRVNERRLGIARDNLGSAQGNLEARLVELYMSGETDLVEIILGSSSLSEILDGIETANRVSDQDAKIIEEVRRFRHEVKVREAQLEKARARQEQVVAERAAKRDQIEATLAEREQLLSSIRSEIERLKAEEAARQRRLEAEARARLANPAPAATAPAQAPAPTSSDEPTGAPPSRHGGVVGIAMQYLGIPYQWGGSSPSTGFDCSGFVMFVYSQVGVSLPHNAAMQYNYGTPVSRSELAPGDLVFFNGLGHNGIYIGGNQMIHSPHSGDVVKISALTGWYASTYVGARRL